MDIHEEATLYDQAHAEAREALKQLGCTIVDYYRTPSNIISFAYGAQLYYLEFSFTTDVATSLPYLLWVLHKEVGRAKTALDVVKAGLP